MDEFASDIITPLKDFGTLTKKEFKPWHKPRKQWCRFNQWALGLNWSIDNSLLGSDTYNYIGLPGDDLLDLRILADCCKNKEKKLKYLGFNNIGSKSQRSSELQLSESELNKKDNIAVDSKVITEPIESLSRKNSSAFRDAKSYNGFHIINFDLCNSITEKGQNTDFECIKALSNLLELQVNYMRDPWALFITSKVSKEAVEDDAMLQLLKVVQDNMKLHKVFSDEVNKILNIDSSTIDNAIKNLSSLSHEEFSTLFTLGFSKWLFIYCESAESRRFDIEMMPSCKYITGDHELISLGFKFTYIQKSLQDKYLSTNIEKNNEKPFEQLCIDAINGVNNICDLDLKLKNDPVLNETLKTHSAKLLSEARYDKLEYDKWVESGCPSQ